MSDQRPGSTRSDKQPPESGAGTDSSATLDKGETGELRANTIAAWLWGQGTLLVSVASLPLLTRALPKSEFGLWSQMLSLSALALLADLGMGSVFLRRIAAAAEDRDGHIRAAMRFYGASGAALGVALLLLSLVPGGIVEPFLHVTQATRLTAVAVITAIAVNLGLRSFGVVLLAQGELAKERVFGAGPAIVGTVLTVAAAYIAHTAIAVAGAYCIVEVSFNVALVVVVVRSLHGLPHDRFSLRPQWRSLLTESRAVLVVELVPPLALTIDATIVGRAKDAIAVALYVTAVRVADIVRRFFSPFCESLYISLCRSREINQQDVQARAGALPWVAVAIGLAAASGAVSIGSRPLSFVFGSGYGAVAPALAVLLLAATLRAVCLPAIHRLQAQASLPPLPRWFLLALAFHIVLAITLVNWFSLTGMAVAVLVAEVLIEVPAVIGGVRRELPAGHTTARLTAAQVGAFVLGAGATLALARERFSGASWATGASAVATAVFGSLGVWLLFRYFGSLGAVKRA